ncbi:dihydropteroate synthase [Pseudonocardia sulfidoxydans NBRC 16205]|uniref:Dihydropteroate synthase n=1 Tax=Pseudonocardia sulfidoxydans NBRC 16205 TaxID=1223511 RepID=A0A511DFY0_9PSEU|nr:dihydropteroate synthase [Pseudonocardia sulfidoxydans]GEL23701.1 dihydropteroate synthase [Pseudonocardia sulfidoxydans NBRC 16205]
MGILNVTPDSFSDGGRYIATSAAVSRGLLMREQGADIIDVGGESTRPGAGRVPAREELRRVVPVVRELVAAGCTVSIDTMRAVVAEACVDAGAVLVNDVSGGLADPAMTRCVAELGTPFVAMHWRGHSADMHRHAHYDDVVGDVLAELRERIDRLVEGGIAVERIIVDPGLGFAKTAEQSWQLLRGLRSLAELGRPLLVGASRKSFLATCLPWEGDETRERRLDAATATVSAAVAVDGAFAVRVHDVAASAAAIRVAEAMREGAARRPLRCAAVDPVGLPRDTDRAAAQVSRT